ncbi:MAG: LD-carboxypeptidase [Cytophagales bacterium]|nr:LD-carboxypeptidase [Cytophagales bacterium]MDW8384749.1 LD-carboxypeptidase [Flammeovirgaceae bacterium]
MRECILPPFLQKGDKIGIVAPSGALSAELELRCLEQQGYKCIIGKNLYKQYGTFAGNDEERCSDLQEMLDDASIKAILCARGGYGITRIIDKLCWSSFLKSPKWIVGFSDITALHLQIQSLGFCSLHAIMPVHFHLPQAVSSLERLLQVLQGKTSAIYFENIIMTEKTPIEGILVGGNLTMLCNQIGTRTLPDSDFFDNKVLFLEETNEPLYQIDRLMTHLARIGVFSKIKALLMGYFTIMPNSPEFGFSLLDIVIEKVRQYGLPVISGIPSGHEFPNFPLILGKKIYISNFEIKYDV